MKLSPLYVQWEQDALQRGQQQGELQGQRLVVENLLKARFGSVDQQLAAVIQPMLELPPEEYASLLLQLSSLSREDLLGRFSPQ